MSNAPQSNDEPFDPRTVPVKPAATVLLIRDAVAGGIEVFMLRRTFSAAFASGMFVFPERCWVVMLCAKW